MARELKPNNFIETLNKYSEGCNKNDCVNCPAYWELKQMCVFDSIRIWRKWVDKKRGGKNNG